MLWRTLWLKRKSSHLFASSQGEILDTSTDISKTSFKVLQILYNETTNSQSLSLCLLNSVMRKRVYK